MTTSSLSPTCIYSQDEHQTLVCRAVGAQPLAVYQSDQTQRKPLAWRGLSRRGFEASLENPEKRVKPRIIKLAFLFPVIQTAKHSLFFLSLSGLC